VTSSALIVSEVFTTWHTKWLLPILDEYYP
jgi:hypothetical protein